jgi:hypothetical protein
MQDFTVGYACACANLVRMDGDSTLARELLACNFLSVKDFRRCGVDEADIKVLLPTIKDIIRRRKINRRARNGTGGTSHNSRFTKCGV